MACFDETRHLIVVHQYSGSMPDLRTSAGYRPMGDQPQAIDALVASVASGNRYQTLLGGIAAERLREHARTGESGDERSGDRGVGLMRRSCRGSHLGTLCLSWRS